MTLLDGPRLPADGPATGLVVLLHGYGADGNDLIDIGATWQPYLPGVAFVSPHAPEPCAMSSFGRQWFPLTLRDPSEYWRGVSAAGPVLDAFLDAERDRLGLADDRIVLVGFSQGTMMALHVGLRRAAAPGAIVGYSGLLAGPEHLAEAVARAKARPKVTLVHGDQDGVIPVRFLTLAAGALAEAGVPVEYHVSPGVAHGIDQRGLILGLSAVAEALGIPLPRG